MTDILRRLSSKLIQMRLERDARRAAPRGYVLMLHNVAAPQPSEFNLPLQAFKRLLINLSRHNCINLAQWEHEPDGFHALTFDDVPANFYTSAWPLLTTAGIPFTIFVNLECLDRQGYLQSSQLREIAASPLCTVGSHGISHGFFRRLSPAKARHDLSESRRRLEQITGRPVELFAFPYGSVYACGLRNIHLAKEIYSYAFSTLNAPVADNPLRKNFFLPRINITESHPLCL